MDFDERQRLVRRIVSGKLYCTVKFQHQSVDVIFTNPSLDLMSQADWLYNKTYQEYKASNEYITLEDSYDILRSDGVWNDDLDDELETLKSDIKELQSKINLLKFQKAQQRAVQATIDKGKKRFIELENIKNQLPHTTIESLAENSKRRFIMSKICQTDQVALLQHPSFLDILIVYYYKEYSPSETQIRELARSDPWRLYWTVSKETGISLFPHSAVEITDLQYALISWSRIYDFAYESTNRPHDDIIKNDDQFDAWYRDECDRLDQEVKKINAERSLPPGAFGGQEVFIPADAEGAREVYKLNDLDGRRRIAQRNQALKQKGMLLESELPDVKTDIKMEMNRLANQQAMARSR